MRRFSGGPLPSAAVVKVRSILQTRFPLVRDDEFHVDDSAAAFILTERFDVHLRLCQGAWFVELNDRDEPLDPLYFGLPLVKAGILDADAVRDVVCQVSEITSERIRERQEMQQVRSAFF